MGDKYDFVKYCPNCGERLECYYAPSCGCMSVECPKCKKLYRLEIDVNLIESTQKEIDIMFGWENTDMEG